MPPLPLWKLGRPESWEVWSLSPEFLFKLGRVEHLLQLFTGVMVCDEDFVSSVGVKEGLDDVPKKLDGKSGVKDKCSSISASVVVTQVADQALKSLFVNSPNSKFSNVQDSHMIFNLAWKQDSLVQVLHDEDNSSESFLHEFLVGHLKLIQNSCLDNHRWSKGSISSMNID